MEVKGEWATSTAGGGLDQPSWRSNTQYILKDVQPGQTVTISLKLEGEADPKHCVGFAIVGKAGQGMHQNTAFTFLHTDDELVVALTDEDGHLNVVHTTVPKKGQIEGLFLHRSCWIHTQAQGEIVVSAEEQPYRVIPYNTYGNTGSFTLKTSVGSLVPGKTPYTGTTLEVCSIETRSDEQGEWNEASSGGPLTEKTFGKNENFFFSLDEASDVVIILSRDTKVGFKGQLGFYLAPVDGISQWFSKSYHQNRLSERKLKL